MIRLLTIIFCTLFCALPVLSQTPAIWLEPDTVFQQNNPTSPIVFDVVCDNQLVDMKGIHLVFSCDPSILRFDTQTTRLGNMFVAHDTVTFFAELTESDGARISIDIAVLGNSSSVNGPGILAKIGAVPAGLDYGTTDMTISELTIRNHLNEDIPSLTTGGWVRVCQFVGDMNGDGYIDISDLTLLVNYLFVIPGQNPPAPLASGDTNCSGFIDISDLTRLVDYLFLKGPDLCGPCVE